MEHDTMKGKTETAIGHAKEAAGKLTGDNELQAEGVKDQAKGQLHETVGAVKEAGKNIASGVKDGIESTKHDN